MLVASGAPNSAMMMHVAGIAILRGIRRDASEKSRPAQFTDSHPETFLEVFVRHKR